MACEMPNSIYKRLKSQLKVFHPRLPWGIMVWETIRSLAAAIPEFHFDLGRPISHFCIENFLTPHADDICERVLEIGDASYIRIFGGNPVREINVLSNWFYG